MHASECIYIHAGLSTPMNESPRRARRTHAPTCCVRARGRERVRLGAHASAPAHASALCRRGPRVARRAGVRLGVGFQREHRRVEHRVSHHVVRGMQRRSGPAARHFGGTRSAGRRCGAGRCAPRRHRSARACVCGDVWALACAGVHVRRYSCIASRTEDGLYVCMDIHACICIQIYMYVCNIHTYLERRACGRIIPDAHVRAMARANDAAVAVTCARGYVRRDICSQRTRHVQYICTYIHRCKVRVCKWVRGCVLAYACGRCRCADTRHVRECDTPTS